MSKRRCILFGTISLILCIVAILLNNTVFSSYTPTIWWRLLYGLDAFCGIGGCIFALVLFGGLLGRRKDGS